MKPQHGHWKWLGWAIFLCVLLFSWRLLFLFRVESFEGLPVGKTQVRYWWGRPSVITIDTDLDGRIEGRYLISAPYGPYASHTAVSLEFWEDRDGDGLLELHVTFGDDEIDSVEVDNDGDGEFEIVLHGEEARNWWRELTEIRIK